MSQASADLQWLVIRNYNSKIVKRKHIGAKSFSTENGNLRNLHSFKYSGLVNPKVVYITSGRGSQPKLATRKSDAPVGHLRKATVSGHKLKRSNRRQTAATAGKATDAYRTDLRKDAIRRAARSC